MYLLTFWLFPPFQALLFIDANLHTADRQLHISLFLRHSGRSVCRSPLFARRSTDEVRRMVFRMKGKDKGAFNVRSETGSSFAKSHTAMNDGLSATQRFSPSYQIKPQRMMNPPQRLPGEISQIAINRTCRMASVLRSSTHLASGPRRFEIAVSRLTNWNSTAFSNEFEFPRGPPVYDARLCANKLWSPVTPWESWL